MNVDFRRPLAVVTPTLDGDILAVLAAADVRLTGREISRRIAASQGGVQRALERLTAQGIVARERAGKAYLHSLNRRHLAAPWIEQLSTLRLALIERLREQVGGWSTPASAVVVFGSVARGEATAESDIDILVVRPRVDPGDDPAWRAQLRELAETATALTGNDARIVELGLDEAHEGGALIDSARRDGIDLAGSLTHLPPARRRRRGRGTR